MTVRVFVTMLLIASLVGQPLLAQSPKDHTMRRTVPLSQLYASVSKDVAQARAVEVYTFGGGVGGAAAQLTRDSIEIYADSKKRQLSQAFRSVCHAEEGRNRPVLKTPVPVAPNIFYSRYIWNLQPIHEYSTP